MRIAILGFVAGAAWLQTQATLPEFPWLLPGAASALASALLTGYAPGGTLARRVARPLRRLLALAAGLMLGVGWAALLAARALAPQLAAADEGRDLTLVGVVDNLPYRFGDGVRFQFKVESVADGTAVPPRVTLSWYAGQRGVVNQVGVVRPGERWRLTVRLQRPHGNANPHGFDYEVWLLEQGVRATGYVRPTRGNRRLDGFVPSVGNVVERSRDALRERILGALPGQEYAAVLVALVVGDQRGIAQTDWQVFNRTGVGHLISISGLHITMVAGLAALAVSALWRRSFFTGAQLPLLLPAQKVAAITGAGVALLYVLLAGFGVPAQRTLYMLAVVAAALWLDRITSVSYVLCAALGLVVLLDPWAVLWPGFWLSFGAVALILYATVGRTANHAGAAGLATGASEPPTTSASASAPARAQAQAQMRARRVWQALRLGAHTQYVVTCGLVPLTMLLFAQVSLVSPLANALAIPLVSLVVTPLALLGSVLPMALAVPVLSLAHWLVRALAACLQWFSGWDLAVWCAPTPPWWLFGWAMLGTLWLLAPRGWPGRWLGLLSWIPLLTAPPASPPAGQLWVTALDVGQGMALLVETSGHRLLYDTGPAYSPESNGGNRVILPYLRARGIAQLDGLIVSHSDIDHAGGALTVLGGVRVGWLLSSLPASHAVVRAAPRHGPCVAGQGWSWDGVRFEMLHPLADSYADAALKPNARGCTLHISAGGRAILLAADIEAAQEAALLARAPERLRADVLLAPHHGSGTSSTLPFLLAVRPELALFQVGYRNRYRHPKAEVFERYGALGVRRLRSDEAGAVTLEFGAGIDVTAYRQRHARYWYAR
ncbi:DNA internalization-related competence protein ComEC/Rec2 [Rugamonas rubra]|uniref:Competence protein ComEC n=1 Tax=Rugamonas rubra TaxID=758825 RepID=A0A1I4S7J3_9BURK|nr:DNA internalization-related competence protein ComEC/Rec2 [Rugamonas rubra]SFM60439.1 competence protein ComEC [Rugamonas rubra]